MGRSPAGRKAVFLLHGRLHPQRGDAVATISAVGWSAGARHYNEGGDFHRIASELGIPLVHMDAAYLAPLVLGEKMVNRDPEMMGILRRAGDSLIIVNKCRPARGHEKAPYQDRTIQMLSWDPHDAELQTS